MLNPFIDPDRPAAGWTIPHLQFSWGAKDCVRGEWYGGLVGFRVTGKPRELWMLVSVRGLLRWSAGAVAAAYLVGSAALAYWLDRSPYNNIGYWDLVLPTRWGQLPTRRGAGLIDQGLHDVRHQNYAEGIVRLQRGLNLIPGDRRARIALGQMYARMGYVHRAMQIYRDGLASGPSERYYVEIVLRLAEYLEDYEAMLGVIAMVEPQPGLESAKQRWLVGRRVEALRRAGRHQEVVALYENHRGPPPAALETAYARALSALGQGQRALEQIERHCAQLVLPQERWELVLAVAQENRLDQAARDALQHLIDLDRNLPRYYIAEIGYLSSIGALAEAEQRIRALFRRFGFEATTGIKLLQRLTGNPHRAMLDSAWREISAAGFAVPAAGVIYVQGLILCGDFAAAREAFDRVAAQLQAIRQPDGGWVDGTKALTDLLLAPSSIPVRERFRAYATSTPLTPQGFRFILQALRQARLNELAEEISLVARNRFPAMTNLPPALLPLSVTRSGAADAARNLYAPTDEFKSPASVSPGAIAVFGSPEKPMLPGNLSQLATWLDKWVAGEKWLEAAAAAEKLEKLIPESRRKPVRLQRIRLSAELGDSLAVSTLMRGLRLDASAELLALRTMAEGLHERGQIDGALAIVREVNRRVPKVKWAQENLRRWQEAIRVAPFEDTGRREPEP